MFIITKSKEIKFIHNNISESSQPFIHEIVNMTCTNVDRKFKNKRSEKWMDYIIKV